MAATMTFPSIYQDRRVDELITAYEAAPVRLRTVVQGLSAADLVAHPVEGKWSVQEIVCHLADADVVGAFRFRLAFAQPGAEAPVYDQALWAQRMRYGDRDVKGFERAMALFTALRADVVALIAGLPSATWTNRIRHPEWGELSLRQVLELYADHGERHIAQILERRALLGKPIDVPILLPERLY